MCAQPKDIINSALFVLPCPSSNSGARFSCFSVRILIISFTFLLVISFEILFEASYLLRISLLFNGDYRIAASDAVLIASCIIGFIQLKAAGQFFVPFTRFAHVCFVYVAFPFLGEFSHMLHSSLLHQCLEILPLPVVMLILFSAF